MHQSILANSEGLFAGHQYTDAEFSITILEENSSGWAKANSPDIRDIDPDELAARASNKATASRKPRDLEPGHYTAILEPSAVLDFIGSLFYDFSATAVQDKRSCLNDRMGKKIFGENITLWDDVYHPLQIGAPYDGEGLPRQRVLLVERGVPKNLVYSRATAKKMKTKPTGHGLPLPNEFGEAPTNLVFAGGDKSVADMVRVDRARHVGHAALVHPRSGPYEKIITGMTRDGTFLVENGRIAGGIRNFRFNQSMHRSAFERGDAGSVCPRCRRRIVRDGGSGDENARLSFQRSNKILKSNSGANACARLLRRRDRRIKNFHLSRSARTATSKNPTIISS